jgi:hypothetical protein
MPTNKLSFMAIILPLAAAVFGVLSLIDIVNPPTGNHIAQPPPATSSVPPTTSSIPAPNVAIQLPAEQNANSTGQNTGGPESTRIIIPPAISRTIPPNRPTPTTTSTKPLIALDSGVELNVPLLDTALSVELLIK